MKRNHSLLEYTRDNDTQVRELGPTGPCCFVFDLVNLFGGSCLGICIVITSLGEREHVTLCFVNMLLSAIVTLLFLLMSFLGNVV